MTNAIPITPREYQKAIFETAKNYNTLVVLPTGLGKTLIALLLTIHRLEKHPKSKILMLAPTKPLVDQHFNTFKSQLPELFADIQLLIGSIPPKKRQSIFTQADIIFATPQTIANDLENSLYDLTNCSLLVIDECHRSLGNYDYTTVLNYYKQQSQNQKILGLTASPGSDTEKIKEICQHLNIEEIEIRTRDSEDVKPYLQRLEFEKVEVPFPREFQEIKTLLKRIYDEKIERLRSNSILFGPASKVSLLQLQNKLSARIQLKDFTAMHAISTTAQAIKISHALELLETQTLSGLNSYLKTLIQQAKEKKSRAVQSLVKSPDFNAALISLQNLLTKQIEHPKIEELATILETQIKNNPKAKTIVFCQFRDTALTILNRLAKIPEIKAHIFVGQAKKSNSGITTGLSQKEQKAIIEKFKVGEINSLIATSIGEEGLDIPEVSAVIFYEPIPSAIRKIQRAGRTARLQPGKLIILITKDTRDIAFHYASSAKERKMYKTIEAVKQELQERQKNPSINKFI